MTEKIKQPTGTEDIYGKNQKYFDRVEEAFYKVAKEYNFERIRTPILEEEALFTTSVGETTDIVQKEMYTLTTKGDDKLALRPEGTAPIVRSYIENDFYKKPQPVKLFYFGPFFRYERPQKGRYRQFHQFGLEVLGKKAPALDAQIIRVIYETFKELELKVKIKVNSLGDKKCRSEYKEKLKEALEPEKEDLCEDCQRRFDTNPLRILDCKNESCQKITANVPQIVDNLCKSCKKDFKSVLEYLDGMNLPYELDPFLVRGLDYYNNTVFEIFTEDDDLALGGGGRYDNLVELLGGRETPAVGVAVGVERLIEAMQNQSIKIENDEKKIFLAQLGKTAKKKAFKLFEQFREEGIPVYESMGRDSLKAQLAKADKLGADYTLILGRQECIKDQIIIREMESGKQHTVKLENIIDEIKKRL
jgi:histidyl-tRNA synthetase